MAAQEEEQSMEDILQSIKKIIAEDDDAEEVVEGAAPEMLEVADMDGAEGDAPDDASKDVPAEPSGQDDIDAMFDSVEIEPEPEVTADAETGLEEIAEALEENEEDDILELTEEVEEEDGGLSGFDEPDVAEAPAVAVEPEVAPVVEDAVVPEPVAVSGDADALLSDEAASKAASALAQLRQPAEPTGEKLAFRSGTTVEDLVLEALKPMLKEWLNSELPATVERMVAEEIKRISQ